MNYAKAIVSELCASFVRCESGVSSNQINGKIQEAEQAKVHTMLDIGGGDMEAGQVSMRLHHGGPQGAKPKPERCGWNGSAGRWPAVFGGPPNPSSNQIDLHETVRRKLV